MPKLKRAGEINQSTDSIEQEIDLKKYVDGELTPTQKRLFAELAIDKINNRTLDGNTINGGKFTKYTKDYADKKGVTRNSVDLFLKGDMLDSLDWEEEEEKIKIKITGDEAKKAYNHNTGDTLPKREFFGITKLEAEEIARNITGKSNGGFTLKELSDALNSIDIQQVGDDGEN